VRRLAFNVIAGASLLLCIATALLWVRSYFAGDKLTCTWALPAEARRVFLPAFTNKGMLYLTRYDFSFSGTLPHGFFGDTTADFDWESFQPFPASGGIAGYFAGFHATDESRTKPLTDPPGVRQTERWRTLTMPLWAPMIAFGVLPGVVLVRYRKRRRRTSRMTRGLCPNCGYDLRATPEVCPECGPVPAAASER
jgi:hypothetical protein